MSTPLGGGHSPRSAQYYGSTPSKGGKGYPKLAPATGYLPPPGSVVEPVLSHHRSSENEKDSSSHKAEGLNSRFSNGDGSKVQLHNNEMGSNSGYSVLHKRNSNSNSQAHSKGNGHVQQQNNNGFNNNWRGQNNSNNRWQNQNSSNKGNGKEKSRYSNTTQYWQTKKPSNQRNAENKNFEFHDCDEQ
jgi:hypothetical protein